MKNLDWPDTIWDTKLRVCLKINRTDDSGDDVVKYDIKVVADDRLVGYVVLRNNHPEKGKATINCEALADRMEGFDREAIFIALTYAFGKLPLTKVVAYVDSGDGKKMAQLRGCGFKVVEAPDDRVSTLMNTKEEFLN